MRNLNTEFLYYWQLLSNDTPMPIQEYHFVREIVGNESGIRKRIKERGLQDWRFDFAWPNEKVAVELEGGTWIKGAHTRGNHYRSDCEKYNFAQISGWKVLRFTGDMLEENPTKCIKLVQLLLINSPP